MVDPKKLTIVKIFLTTVKKNKKKALLEEIETAILGKYEVEITHQFHEKKIVQEQGIIKDFFYKNSVPMIFLETGLPIKLVDIRSVSSISKNKA